MGRNGKGACLCPKCGSIDRSVLETRMQPRYVRRRSQCSSCGYRYTTHENVHPSEPLGVDLQRDAAIRVLRYRCDRLQVALDGLRSALDQFTSDEPGLPADPVAAVSIPYPHSQTTDACAHL